MITCSYEAFLSFAGHLGFDCGHRQRRCGRARVRSNNRSAAETSLTMICTPGPRSRQTTTAILLLCMILMFALLIRAAGPAFMYDQQATATHAAEQQQCLLQHPLIHDVCITQDISKCQ